LTLANILRGDLIIKFPPHHGICTKYSHQPWRLKLFFRFPWLFRHSTKNWLFRHFPWIFSVDTSPFCVFFFYQIFILVALFGATSAAKTNTYTFCQGFFDIKDLIFWFARCTVAQCVMWYFEVCEYFLFNDIWSIDFTCSLQWCQKFKSL
jgi:hypothetical protein